MCGEHQFQGGEIMLDYQKLKQLPEYQQLIADAVLTGYLPLAELPAALADMPADDRIQSQGPSSQTA
jgi:hypothetical protein